MKTLFLLSVLLYFVALFVVTVNVTAGTYLYYASLVCLGGGLVVRFVKLNKLYASDKR